MEGHDLAILSDSVTTIDSLSLMESTILWDSVGISSLSDSEKFDSRRPKFDWRE